MVSVHIELQRVQTWLFATPRLRTMVGANVLLGEALRLDLRELLVDERKREAPRWRTQSLGDGYPPKCEDDPLGARSDSRQTSDRHDDRRDGIIDDPSADAAIGILSRDGGHFEAAFEDDQGARAFATEAEYLLRSKLPGLRFGITLRTSMSADDRGEPLVTEDAALSIELPVLARCDWAGRGLASAVVEPGGDDEDRAEVSLDAAQRVEAARRAAHGHAHDLVTHIRERCKQSTAGPLLMADLFETLADGKFLAVIHADGNGVGGALPRNATDPQRATFFHRNRVLLRKAVVKAMDKAHEGLRAFHDDRPGPKPCRDKHKRLVSPLLPMMLGGDDLLVVCRADMALSFVRDLCAELDDLQRDTPPDDFRLTLGVGVVIASYALPFHQLHHVAETLASSAKRTVRGRPANELCSVVDWQVFTASWAEDDLGTARRRDWIRGDCILSRRPLPVLGNAGHGPSLESLLGDAGGLANASRSQLHYLKQQLACGKHLAQLAFDELPTRTRNAFPDHIRSSKSIWEPVDGKHLTSLFDLIEVTEIGRLGRTAQKGGAHEQAQ